jgi:hypothetical protein
MAEARLLVDFLIGVGILWLAFELGRIYER